MFDRSGAQQASAINGFDPTWTPDLDTADRQARLSHTAVARSQHLTWRPTLTHEQAMRHTCRQAVGQTDGWADRQTDGQRGTQAGRETDRLRNRPGDRQEDRLTDKQIQK